MALSTFLSACGNAPQSERSESSVKKSVVVDRKDIDFEDLNTEDVKTSIEKYSKDLGIPRVKEIDIYWQLAADQSSQGKGVSKFLFAQKKVSLDSPYMISKLLKYIVTSKNAGQDELFGLNTVDTKSYSLERKDRLEEINSELKGIKDGKLKKQKFNYVQYGGYFYFPGVSEGDFSEYRPSIRLVSEGGKQLEFDFNLDSLHLIFQKKGSNNVKVFSDDGYKYFLGMMEAKDLSDKIGKDTYKILKNYKLSPDYLMSVKVIRMPEKLKEDTFGDRFNLYWASVDTMIKSNGFKDGLSKHLGKDVSLETYHLTGIKKKANTGEDYYVDVNKVFVLRDGSEQLGVYLSAGNFMLNLEQKYLEDVTGITYESWLDKMIEDDQYGREIGKLDAHEFIKKYVDLITVPDFDDKSMFVPTLDEYVGKTSDMSSPYVSDMDNNNLISASLVSVKDMNDVDGFNGSYKQKPDDIVLNVVIDYKFKEEMSRSSGESETNFTLRKISDRLGYRIVSMGI